MLVGDSSSEEAAGKTSQSEFRIPAAVSDTGCERELNEDRYAVIESPNGLAWIVCDGMGGVSGGELAAQLAIDAMKRDLEAAPDRSIEGALKSAVNEANRVIVLRRQNQAFGQMGTTVVAAMFNGAEVVVGHAGDSRAYLVRDEAIQQLTIDHTYVQELVDKGQITSEEALSHPHAHVLTRCLGAQPALEISLQKYWIWDVPPTEPRDVLMLCSDGLYGLVDEADIARIISQEPPQRACMSLVELAKERGGYDNITVAIIPLTGQLRQEAPELTPSQKTKKSQKAAKQSRKGGAAVQVAPRNIARIVVSVGLLSLLSFLLTILVVSLTVSR